MTAARDSAPARDAILVAVRSAISGAREQPPADVLRGYRYPRAVADLAGLFVERVEDYRASVVRCAEPDVLRTVTDLLDGRSAVVPPALSWVVPEAIVDDGLSVAEVERLQAVVTQAAVGIAETGTIVLDHQGDQGRRLISLLPDLHVCILRADQLVATVPEAVAALHPGRPQTWISGPSATSDIELDRVEGVHGPRTLNVVLVEAGASAGSRIG